MITNTPYHIDLDTIRECLEIVQNSNIHDVKKLILNRPIGRFFYDEWQLKDEFHNTAVQRLYDSLPVKDKGEARIIKLNGGECYVSHSDLDDRYHMNIFGDKCYLVNLDTNVLYPVVTDGIWYDMDAGPRHSAINFGNEPRYQLVIRRLLNEPDAQGFVHMTIVPRAGADLDVARFKFDDSVSQLLSIANKSMSLANFQTDNFFVSMDVTPAMYEKIKAALPQEFEVK